MTVGNITNVIPASELPVMTEAEYLANVNTLTVDGTGKLKHARLSGGDKKEYGSGQSCRRV